MDVNLLKMVIKKAAEDIVKATRISIISGVPGKKGMQKSLKAISLWLIYFNGRYSTAYTQLKAVPVAFNSSYYSISNFLK